MCVVLSSDSAVQVQNPGAGMVGLPGRARRAESLGAVMPRQDLCHGRVHADPETATADEVPGQSFQQAEVNGSAVLFHFQASRIAGLALS